MALCPKLKKEKSDGGVQEREERGGLGNRKTTEHVKEDANYWRQHSFIKDLGDDGERKRGVVGSVKLRKQAPAFIMGDPHSFVGPYRLPRIDAHNSQTRVLHFL
jgi:hypothetical protein